jgi:hypothetical protein
MAIPTWRNMVAPKLSTQDISKANANSVAAMDKILKGFTDLDDTSGDIMKTQATNALSNVIPNAGESRAAARERFVQANPDAFGSSYLDVDAMSGIEKSLSALDAGKKKIDNENIITGEVEQIENINPMENPAEARIALNNIHTQNRLNNVSDPDNRLKYYSDQLLRSTQYNLSPETIARAGGVVGDEKTYTPDVVANVREAISNKVRKDNMGASEVQVQATVDRIIKETPYGRAFARGIDQDKKLTYKDKQFQEIATRITDAFVGGDNDLLIDEVNKASAILQSNPQWDETDAAFITQPIINALDGMNVKALDEWRKLGLSSQATISEQESFRDNMYTLYRSKFPALPKKVIDQKIRNDIKDNRTLSAMINQGNTIAEFRAKRLEDALTGENQYTNELNQFWLRNRKTPVSKMAADDLFDKIKRKLPEVKWDGLKLSKLNQQTQKVTDKIRKVFSHPEGTTDSSGNDISGRSTLTEGNKATLDLAIYRFLTEMGGYDPDEGFLPFDNPDWSLMTIDENSDMANADVNKLIEGLNRYLPKMSERKASVRKAFKSGKAGVLLDDQINAFLKNHPPVSVKRPPTKEEIRANYEQEMGKGLSWYNVESWWPWFNKKYGDKISKKMGWQTVDQTRANIMVDPAAK